MKYFTTVNDITDPEGLVKAALALKKNPFAHSHLGKNKTLGLIFLNPSLRTRLSTQKAARMLGMDVVIMNMDKESWAIEWKDDVIMNGSTVEHIKDAAAVLGMYCDIIGIRCFASLSDRGQDYSEHLLVQLMRYCQVPVVSLESATLHPLQSLADAITIAEHQRKGIKPKVVLTWAPHIKPLPQAVANSFSEWMLRLNTDVTIACPEGYDLCEDYTRGAKLTHNQEEALKDADFIYVKNWSAYEPYGAMPDVKTNWMLTEEKYRLSAQAHIMHCLPVRRNLELSSALIDHPNSLVKHQADNRLYATMVVLKTMLETVRKTETSTIEVQGIEQV